MVEPKLGKSANGRDMHYGVGAIIKKDDKYLLIDRVKPPLGHASVAGHIDDGENEIQTLFREVEEESGLKVEKYDKIIEEEVPWNFCHRGIKTHYWYVFNCDVSGEVKQNFAETKSIGWYTIDEIKKLELEPVWKYFFEKLKII